MNSASPTLLECMRSHAKRKAWRELGNRNVSHVTRSHGRRPPGPSTRESAAAPGTRATTSGRSSTSGAGWSASPMRSLRSPYRAWSHEVNVSAEVPSVLKSSRSSSLRMTTSIPRWVAIRIHELTRRAAERPARVKSPCPPQA